MIGQGNLFHVQLLEVEQDLLRAKILMDLEEVPPVPLLGARVFGAFFKGQLVGAVVAEQTGQGLLLSSLVVRDIFRGVGIGKELIGTLVKFAREKGLAKVFVAPRKSATYFKRFGFKQVSRTSLPKEVSSHLLLRVTNGLKVFEKAVLFYDMPVKANHRRVRQSCVASGRLLRLKREKTRKQ